MNSSGRRTPASFRQWELPTPPISPEKLFTRKSRVAGSKIGSHYDGPDEEIDGSSCDETIFEPSLFKNKPRRSHNFNSSLLTPPSSPPNSRTTLHSHATTCSVPPPLSFGDRSPLPSSPETTSSIPFQHLDGIDDKLFSLSLDPVKYQQRSNPEESSPEEAGSRTSIEDVAPADSLDPIFVSRQHRPVDLASPKDCPFPIAPPLGLDTPTPLVQASPVDSAFPFPRQGRLASSLSPLTARAPRYHSLPAQVHRSSSLRSRARRLSDGPDRFIPERLITQRGPENLKLSKPPDQLSDTERLLRRRGLDHDPFRQRPRRGMRLTLENLSTTTGPGPPFTHPTLQLRRATRAGLRQVSRGAVWGIGAAATTSDSVVGVSDGRGGLFGRGTNAPLYSSRFFTNHDPSHDKELYEQRLALAFDIDRSTRVIGPSTPIEPSKASTRPLPGSPHTPTKLRSNPARRETTWKDNQWTTHEMDRILDAPDLRDDYYCSLLAYSSTTKCLAVGLGNFVYLWSETHGVNTPESLNQNTAAYVTSLSFSSTTGGKAILAVGRVDGCALLWSSFDDEPRFDIKLPKPISCLSFRPNTTKRPSLRDFHVVVETEELLIGDEEGSVYFYSVEWPSNIERDLFAWPGEMTLLCQIRVNTQQICGLSWSSDGDMFASGGNDNVCALFETARVTSITTSAAQHQANLLATSGGVQNWTIIPGAGVVPVVSSDLVKQKWILNAAVKAIAFCPWQRGLLAIGGGSNDRCVHFYHAISGACLATIDCSAQVTSLVWSSTRKEICATFGFAQPDHPYRIAVFAWPSCEQVMAIPWQDEHRALFAIAYPGGPDAGKKNVEGGAWWSRTAEEGCIVVATSDASIKFHEVWSEEPRATVGGRGLLGGSDILESLHGLDQRGNEGVR